MVGALQPREVYLQPGGFHFGGTHTRIMTVLGSCVAITLWHPRLRHGGMCHYMLPEGAATGPVDGRYADAALRLFMQALQQHQTYPAEYEVKLFGGGCMFLLPKDRDSTTDIGQRNIEAGRRLLREHGFIVLAEQVGGNGHRNVSFELSNGDVWVRHMPELVIRQHRRKKPGGA